MSTVPLPIHVAILTETGSGHINPLVELSLRLIPLGFSVDFLLFENQFNKVREIKEDSFRFVPIPNSGSMILSPEMQEPVEEIIRALQPPVSYLISDFFVGWSYDLAKSLGIPNIAFASCNAVGETVCCYLPELMEKEYLSSDIYQLNAKELITFIPPLKSFPPTLLPFGFFEAGPFIVELSKAAPRIREAFCVLVNTTEELEEEVVTARRSEIPYYLPVGPLLPEALPKDEKVTASDMESPCLKWLDKQAPSSVLYVAFGSVVSLTTSKVEKLAHGLEASQQKFLWAVRRGFFKDAPENFFETLQTRFGDEKGLVVEWAPQVQVLRHPSVSGFLTHCGWNSTQEAICAGVPLLCWPCAAEQNTNAYTIVNKWKIGMQLAEGLPDEVLELDNIEKTIRSFMRSEQREELKERVEGLRRVVMEGRCSKQNLLRFRNLCLEGKS